MLISTLASYLSALAPPPSSSSRSPKNKTFDLTRERKR